MDNVANMNVTLPSLQAVQPTQLDAYLIVARDLLKGADVLSKEKNIPSRSCGLIAAHALECMLKAYLWHKGKRKEIRERNTQHNLKTLWDLAHNENSLNLPKSPPDWVQTLSVGHGPNFYFRYQEGENKTVVNGGSTPSLIPMCFELNDLLKRIESLVKA